MVEPPGVPQPQEAARGKDSDVDRRGKERGRPAESLAAVRPEIVPVPDRCHVYLAGPEDYRSGLDERENERLEAAAEELLIQGKKLAAVERHDLRGKAGVRRGDEVGVPWTGDYWRAMKMREYETIRESFLV